MRGKIFMPKLLPGIVACTGAIVIASENSNPEAALVPGCVKTLRGITAPGILRLVVTLRAKKRKNSSSARRYDQIRFRFHTAWVKTCLLSTARMSAFASFGHRASLAI
jgi:hypothetical protein